MVANEVGLPNLVQFKEAHFGFPEEFEIGVVLLDSWQMSNDDGGIRNPPDED